MSSFDAVNYSLRPSKSIQRHLVMQGVNDIRLRLELSDLVYIGFGSIWFTDFVLAHKLLGVSDMVSIEIDEIGYRRALFNSPYASVRVCNGHSSAILPGLYADQSINSRPWVVWLDYDGSFSEESKADITSIIENAPSNSVVLVTFNGHEMQYGEAKDRPERLRALFGASVPDDLSKRACRGDRMQATLADLSLKLMQSVANDISRPGGFCPAVRLSYRDSAPMVTVGGILPSPEKATSAAELVNDDAWKCMPLEPIVAPHLTFKEAAVLQRQLPCAAPIGRAAVQALGFDLSEDQIEAFRRYYLYYPSFAQIVA